MRILILLLLIASCHSKQPIISPVAIGGVCNAIVGSAAEYDPAKSYQVVIQPDTELQREYAIETMRNFVRSHPNEEQKCLDVYAEALRQLQSTIIYKPMVGVHI